jgi:two-component system CheB/CheR fusion protein
LTSDKSKARRALAVGIGASAGGLEACREFFDAMPGVPDMAFVVVMHIDRHRASHIAEILQKHTEMKVAQAEGSCRLEVGHVYVIAPNTELSIQDDTLTVEPRDQNPQGSGLIDGLFSSLCGSHGKRCVGIVLSGSGRDGASGLQGIRAGGGLCIAQDPKSAQFASMPEAAIEAGAHAVLKPADMPALLLEFERTGIRPEGAKPAAEKGDARTAIRASGFEGVLELIGNHFEVDFDDYKEGTLKRRAQRRMALKELGDWDEYLKFLCKDADEPAALYRDVLIGVTGFFRDPEVWERLGHELPRLLESRSGDGFRAWVPGCATGEEAYTLAMLLLEQLPDRQGAGIQIYATDLSVPALTAARRGLYPEDIAQNISEERLERFFSRQDGRLRIEPRVRECVTFAPHNVLADAPFSKMDLVSCRNLLIYLRQEAHERLLKRLHFALRPGGLLVLGRSESMGRQGRLFDEVYKRQAIYRARPVASHHDYRLNLRTSSRVAGAEQQHAPPADGRPKETAARDRIKQFVLTRPTPARVVIDRELQILHFYGDAHPYLVPPTGESSQDLLSWVRPGFYIALRGALNHAFESHEVTTIEGQLDRDGRTTRVQCIIEPVPAATGARGLFMLTFHDIATAPGEPHPMEHARAEEPLARQLETELNDTRRELQSAVEQLEASGEEYRASHEELLSLNEELQSSNEELEASKEELESLNEEMNTINKELEDKNSELREANADLQNLFTSSGIPTIFLDRELNVRRYTSAATEVMRLVAADVGRSIEHIKERFQDGRLLADANAALKGESPDFEVRTEDGRWYLRRVVPYLLDGVIDGVCITFNDITAQKEAFEASEAHREYAQAIIRTVRTPLIVFDHEFCIVSTNQAFDDTFQTDGDSIKGAGLDAIDDPRWNPDRLHPMLQELFTERREIRDFEVQTAEHTILINAYAMDRDRQPKQILMSVEDVAAQKKLQRAEMARSVELVEEAGRKDEWTAMLGHELRNPIGAISIGLELLGDGKDPAVQDHARAVMRRQLDQVRLLLDDLLDAGRIIAGKLQISRERVDLVDVAESAVETTAGALEERDHRLSLSLPERGEVLVEGDAGRLTEVIVNLLSNAAKYSEDGGRIELCITAGGDTATINVKDTGIGMTADFMPCIFQVFTQGPRSLGRAESGLGLGLPLVRRIAELHGGKVEAFSAGEGKGSRFEVRLPRLIDAPTAREEPPSTDSRNEASRRVLIVDDSRDAAELLGEVLRMNGHDFRVVHDGPAALKAALEFKPDIVLLDLGLPGMDGYEVARRLREQGGNMRLIAVTGYKRDAERLKEAGFDDHAIKPVDFRQLWKKLAASA